MFLKNYLKAENNWDPILIVQYFWKLFSTFYNKYLKKFIAILLFIDFSLHIARLIINMLF